MVNIQDYYNARDTIEEFLRLELIGPVSEDETLRERPDTVYSLGVLWPQRHRLEGTVKADDAVDLLINELHGDEADTQLSDLAFSDLEEDLEDISSRVLNTNAYKPSGLGITVMVPPYVTWIKARFTGARYRFDQQEEIRKRNLRDGSVTSRKWTVSVYHREPFDTGELVLDVANNRVYPDGFPDLELAIFVRHRYADGSRLVTICVTNTSTPKTTSLVDVAQNAVFQSLLELKVDSTFLALEEKNAIHHDLELETLNMLYRNVANFAIGHGCSVKWEMENGSVRQIASEFFPRVDLVPMEPRVIDPGLRLELEFLARCNRRDGVENLHLLVNRYREWLVDLKQKALDISGFKKAMTNSFANIENCLERLSNGIKILKKNDLAWQAFQLTNEAMLMQRVNSGKAMGHQVTPQTVAWYPFQLAYILQVIPDIVEEASEWRDIVDLLWYPTGGGKTEAYLGLAAFTLFYRRLSLGKKSSGVTILMRYTLRLLTAQQFERASSLICACEYLRHTKGIPGGEISIGLWVGQSVTPNSIEDVEKALQDLRLGRRLLEKNPVQIFRCPFCGEKLDVGCYAVEDDSLRISCRNGDCHFSRGLPIYVVDDDIYAKRPTLVLGTVDKFARIVWQDRTTAIFGSDGLTPPPELIIQDELHLISGPLGSLAGLYECAIDELCTSNNIRPKVIASTATVRNATNQIKALYNRDSFQFPPTGLDIDDLFFAVRSDPNKRPSRRYLGICDTGNSMLDLLVRVYGCLLFAAKYLEATGCPAEVVDQYYTIVGYFNTLRELGSSATVISDRVVAYSNSLRLHKFRAYAEQVNMEKITIGSHRELTSRRSTQEIKETLEDLDYRYPDKRAISYVLASNMLSVGIDIGRLGVMTVYRQPKLNAEYIQATSRVGRSNPGLVITMYSNLASRDKSHFEQFIYYHDTFYKHVEPTSVTPFSYRSLEKALHAVYVALVRHKVDRLRSNSDAVHYDRDHPEVRRIRKYLLERVEDVAPEALEHARYWLTDFEELWQSIVTNGAGLVYSLGNKPESQVTTLLIESEKLNTTEIPSTLNSLRNVDGMCNVYLLERKE